MKTNLSSNELKFIKTSLQYGFDSYKQKCSQYMKIEGYRESTYLPTKKEYEDIIQKIQIMIEEKK